MDDKLGRRIDERSCDLRDGRQDELKDGRKDVRTDENLKSLFEKVKKTDERGTVMHGMHLNSETMWPMTTQRMAARFRQGRVKLGIQLKNGKR